MMWLSGRPIKGALAAKSGSILICFTESPADEVRASYCTNYISIVSSIGRKARLHARNANLSAQGAIVLWEGKRDSPLIEYFARLTRTACRGTHEIITAKAITLTARESVSNPDEQWRIAALGLVAVLGPIAGASVMSKEDL